MRFAVFFLATLLALGSLPVAADQPGPWYGRPLADYLDALDDAGLRIIYSSDLVGDEQVLLEEPDWTEPRTSIVSILRPYGLKVIDGPSASLLVVRDGGQAIESGPASASAVTPLPEIVVSSSLHRVQYVKSGTHTYLERELATRIPAAAEEAARVTNRLPGTASGGLSSQNHIRGGEVNEVLFLFDGLRLYEPYHLKNFQAVASIVNPAAIAGIDFYTGGYPVRYGDRMSGVIDMQMREPAQQSETELALSFYNASALSLGRFGANGRGDWLAAVRRGNLDLIVDVIDPEYGSPDYHDLLLHLGWEFGPRAQLSANILVSNDKISLSDDDVGESAAADYENQMLWLKWIAVWNDVLESETILYVNDIADERNGSIDLPGIVSGVLEESREFMAYELQQDWTVSPSNNWMLNVGFRARQQDAEYRFAAVKSVLPPFDDILDNQPSLNRNIEVTPEGAQYAAYSELRWQPTDKWVVDVGVRWDQQTYTRSDDDRQYSPRASVLYRSGDRTEIRIGMGQFYQAQEINELQVSDGVDRFFPAQRATHVVANLKHGLRSGIDIDVSLYRKAFRSLRPRFENVYDQLTLVPELQFDRVMINATRSESRGIELTASSGSAGDDLFWWISYAWSEVEDTTPVGKTKRSWDQTHTGKFGLSWRWGHWDFSAAGEVHTGWPRSAIDAGINSSRYSLFHALDARVSRDFELRRGTLTAFLDVTNVYNRSNPCCTEYSLQAGAGGPDERVAAEKYWLPLVPSLGVVWRF